jgi:hypothetical protein
MTSPAPTGNGKVDLRNWVWEQSNATGTNKLVALALVERYNVDLCKAWPTQADLVAMTGLAKDTVGKALDALVASGEWDRKVLWGNRREYRPTLLPGVFAADARRSNAQPINPAKAPQLPSLPATAQLPSLPATELPNLPATELPNLPAASSRVFRQEQEEEQEVEQGEEQEDATSADASGPATTVSSIDSNGKSSSDEQPTTPWDLRQQFLDGYVKRHDSTYPDRLAGQLLKQVGNALKAGQTPQAVTSGLRRLLMAYPTAPAKLEIALVEVATHPGIDRTSLPTWEFEKQQKAAKATAAAAPAAAIRSRMSQYTPPAEQDAA